MRIKFNQRVKHGRLDLHPGPVYDFEDPDAGPYFIACGWAADASGSAAESITIGLAEIDIDPMTVSAETGKFVLAKYAEAHQAAHDGNPPPPPHEIQFQSGMIAPAPEA